ncbi:MAG: thiol:disulfide interchange protein DsbA/DsbL [Formosimonas sp.]
MKRHLKIGLLAVTLMLHCALPADAANYFSDNQPVNPVVNAGRVQPLGEVEVVEFFWYGCPHCAAFEPYVQAWAKELPAKVKFIRLPASWNESMSVQQRLYFSLEALNRLDLHDKVLSDIHTKKQKLNTEKAIAAWAKVQKIDPKLWSDTFNSPQVQERVAYAQAAFKRFELNWVPALVINGQYVVAFTPDILSNAEQVVQQELRLLESTIEGK